MFALISSEELESLGQIMVKQLKNRYNDPTIHKRFIVGIDRAKMRLYDCEQTAQDDVIDKGKEEEYTYEESKPKKSLLDLSFHESYYSVFDPDGKKIADCGQERDAVNLIGSRNRRWDGHYYQFNPLPGDIIDVSEGKQLPTRDIVVNMDGGVGGSWKEVEYIEVNGQRLDVQQKLPIRTRTIYP